MKRHVVVAALGVLLAGCSRPGGQAASAPPSPSPAAGDPSRPLPSPVPSLVARVNGQPIYLAQIVPMAKAELDRMPPAERTYRRPEALRRSLRQYVERELLFQEAMARGVQADARQVDWAHDQARREHAGERAWEDFLAGLGMDEKSFRTELRVQQTVAALLEQEVGRVEVPEAESRAEYDANPAAFTGAEGAPPPAYEAVRGRIEQAIRERKRGAVAEDLLKRLRARARIETFL